MKKNIIYFFIVAAILFAACEKILEKSPPLQLDNEQVLTDYNLLLQATNAAYSPLYSANWYGRAHLVVPDLMGNNAKQSPRSSGRFQQTYNWNYTPGDNVGLWTTAYDVIARANNVLEYVDNIDQEGITQVMKDQVKGECLFLRALGHWDLVRLFAQPYTYQGGNTPGVPIIRKTEIAEPARETVKDVYELLIVPDLLEAISLLGDPDRGNNPKAFANKEAAQAILAKVYLYMGRWADAATYATSVITSGKFTLYTAANYTTVWSTPAATEVIFLIYGNNTESNFPSWDEVGYIYNPTGYGDVCASNELRNLFDPADVRRQMFKSDPLYPAYFWPTKFPGKGGDTRVNDISVIRLSEMYLIRAEAVLNGASGDALADYNMIRTNRGLGAAASVDLDDIYLERRLELCFEGNRLWDLSRTGRSLERDNEDNKITIAENEDIAFPDYKWALPIPIVEMQANDNMVQNAGY
ncbi:MAG TPA: RagB/SusD family nutrient uptake outer membrane protein [Bacteroidales bacterium]|nr:RagB/SusD family nutrient uptake outer membrane protein [Bacteroidales bacterium]